MSLEDFYGFVGGQRLLRDGAPPGALIDLYFSHERQAWDFEHRIFVIAASRLEVIVGVVDRSRATSIQLGRGGGFRTVGDCRLQWATLRAALQRTYGYEGIEIVLAPGTAASHVTYPAAADSQVEIALDQAGCAVGLRIAAITPVKAGTRGASTS